MAYRDSDDQSPKMYHNLVGKSRLAADSEITQRESALRKVFFAEFASEFISLLQAEGFTEPQVNIVGSVAHDQANAQSDVDFRLTYKGITNERLNVADGIARRIFSSLVKQWKQKNKYTYDLQLWTGENQMIGNAVQRFRFEQQNKRS
jgi:hypothetical protein